MLWALAWRNLWRQPRRTTINLLAIVFACVIIIFMLSLQVGVYNSMITHSLRLFEGYAQIQHPDFLAAPGIRKTISQPHTLIKEIKALPEIAAVSVRALSYVLLASPTRTYGAQIIGVEPNQEPLLSTLSSTIRQGRFLAGHGATSEQLADSYSTNEIVLGERLARNLQVKIGDEVSLLGNGFEGSVAVDRLTVVGIFASGIQELDRQMAQMPLSRFQETFSLGQQVHTLVLTTESLNQLKSILPQLRQLAHQQELKVRDWNALVPGLKQAIQLDAIIALLFYLALLIILVLSILNSFLMSILERTQEFGVLLALGMRPGALGRLVWLETLLLVLLSLGIGILVGYLVTFYFVINGIDFEQGSTLLAQFGMPNELRPQINLFSLLVGPSVIALCVILAAALPTIRIYRLKPVNAMKTAL